MPKEIPLSTRVNDEESAQIKSQAAKLGLNVSDYIRYKLFEPDPTPKINAYAKELEILREKFNNLRQLITLLFEILLSVSFNLTPESRQAIESMRGFDLSFEEMKERINTLRSQNTINGIPPKVVAGGAFIALLLIIMAYYSGKDKGKKECPS